MDNRETKVIPSFKDTNNVTHKILQLKHADYIITFKGYIIAIIERKRWSDLSASILDKRIMNMNNLIVLRDRVNCPLLMIIEGAKPSRNKARGVSYKGMRSKLDHLMSRDRVLMDYTMSSADTAARIMEFANNCYTLALHTEFPVSHDVHTATLEEICGGVKSPQIKKMNENKERYTTWCTLPGVEMTTAIMLQDAKITLASLLTGKADMDKIAQLKYDSGKPIGATRAAAIVRGAKTASAHAKFLASIKGITSKLATHILEHTTMLKIISGDGVSVLTGIPPIKKGGNRIGAVIAQRIISTIRDEQPNHSATSDISDDESASTVGRKKKQSSSSSESSSDDEPSARKKKLSHSSESSSNDEHTSTVGRKKKPSSSSSESSSDDEPRPIPIVTRKKPAARSANSAKKKPADQSTSSDSD